MVEHSDIKPPTNYVEIVDKPGHHKHSPNFVDVSPNNLIPVSSSNLIELQDASTKISARSYDNRKPIYVENIRHDSVEIRPSYIENKRHQSVEIRPNYVENPRHGSVENSRPVYIEKRKYDEKRKRTEDSLERRPSLAEYKKYNGGYHRVPIEAEKRI